MLAVTEAARDKFLEIIAAQPVDGLAVRVRIVGRGINAFAYDLNLVPDGMQEPGDMVLHEGDLTVFVDAGSAPDLEGATVEFNAEAGGFEIDNPNPVWTDELGPVVARVLIEQINPSIASHGGAILPVDVKDGVVYIRMMGGCQGCGMASVTLTEGVEQAIRQALPQIREIVDVTHHAAGTNPYYAS